jgi:hypothetical protein
VTTIDTELTRLIGARSFRVVADVGIGQRCDHQRAKVADHQRVATFGDFAATPIPRADRAALSITTAAPIARRASGCARDDIGVAAGG